MKQLWRGLAGVAIVALGTWILGWTVPVWWGALVGLVWPRDRPVIAAALHGALGWGAILMASVAQGDPVGTLTVRLAGAMQLPAWVLILVTLLFPSLLAASAAWVTSVLRSTAGVRRVAP